jgi:integrase
LLLVEATHNGKVIECMAGPDRAIMYILAAWTGFRKGEIGSMTRRSFKLNDDPATATVEACYSKRKRQDTQVLHPDLVHRLRDWLATKSQFKFEVCFSGLGARPRRHRTEDTQDDAARFASGPNQMDWVHLDSR